MFQNEITINLKHKDDNFHLRPLGDIHIGNLGCDLEKLQKNIDFVKSRSDYYWIGMGDYIDNITAYANGRVDKRWNPDTVDRKAMTTEEQTDRFLKYFLPIKDKCWGLLAGNHEWKTINRDRFEKDFCKPLGSKYLGRLSQLTIKVKYKGNFLRKYNGLVMHGGYSGFQAGGAVNRMKQIGADFEADFVLMGHNHDTWTRTGIRIASGDKKGELREQKIVYANTGTFLRGYQLGVDSYVEINPREAKRVGTVTLTFQPSIGEIYGHD